LIFDFRSGSELATSLAVLCQSANRKSQIKNQKSLPPFPRVETGGIRAGPDQSRSASRRFPVATSIDWRKRPTIARLPENDALGYAGFALSTDATPLVIAKPKRLAADGLGPPAAGDHP
jgi:hypothetical protein